MSSGAAPADPTVTCRRSTYLRRLFARESRSTTASCLVLAGSVTSHLEEEIMAEGVVLLI